ncbi:MAG: alpha/beta hydrolase, partial [Acidobacteria bacterium]|nr:alpha/beta hydrolase [Acidobacteriota bacterium]
PAAAPAAAEAPKPGPMDLFAAFSRVQLAGAGFTRHEAEVDGGRFVWWEKGSGPTVVLLHGVTDQAGGWFQVAPGLAESHRVLLVDLPGHGESDPKTGPLPMSLVVTRFEAWLAEDAGVENEAAKSILVGNSMGAWVAMLVAQRHPELVSRVVAINGGPLRADTGDLDLLPQDREEARRLMAAIRDPASPPTPDVVLDDLVRRAPRAQVARMLEAREDLESFFLEGRLGEIETPIEIVWGESDRYMGRDYPDRLLAGLPHAHLTLVPKCGHVPQIECPATLAPILVEVLAPTEPANAPADPSESASPMPPADSASPTTAPSTTASTLGGLL